LLSNAVGAKRPTIRAHYDHAQGIPNLRRAAAKAGREVKVYLHEIVVMPADGYRTSKRLQGKDRYTSRMSEGRRPD
jgi:phosphoribosyl 1,2-cyclic phosphodiesterase